MLSKLLSASPLLRGQGCGACLNMAVAAFLTALNGLGNGAFWTSAAM
jgi:hypothetical protein